jgi:galactitol-specific phosphotransferase system IIB component
MHPGQRKDAGSFRLSLQLGRQLGMAFNYSKCKVMHVGKKNPKYDYFMRGTKVSTTDEERDVGVLISSNLSTTVTGILS